MIPSMRSYVERRMKLLAKVIMPLNRTGVRLDTALQKQLLTSHKQKVKTWQKDIKNHLKDLDLGEPPIGAQGGFSSKKMQELLYDKLELPLKRNPKPPHQITTDKDALVSLEKKDTTGTISLLLVRSRAKSVETAINVKADPDGRVRTRFVLGGDEKSDQNEIGKESPGSGRLSSRNPNLQNLKEWARMLYVPTQASGWIMKADYNQIELRLIAEFSGDVALKIALLGDAHLFIMHKIGPEKATFESLLKKYKQGETEIVEQRDESKRTTYGWCYRMGAKTLENVKGVPFQQGKKGLDALNRLFWRVPEWWLSLVKEVRESAGGGEFGYLTLPCGRKRYFLLSDVPKICNFKPQGNATEILFDASEILVPETPKKFPGTKVILTVHDELVFDVHPSTDVLKLAAWVKKIMEHPVKELNGLVIPVDILVGRNWAKQHVCRNKNCPVPSNPEGCMKLDEWRKRYA